mmetsp:Transcript_119333/g.210860  ORF Transcript_119333/g.210860 Transcript_119333/m.210860 type:complete len:432 (+) Transcript_119333:144-1439(+)
MLTRLPNMRQIQHVFRALPRRPNQYISSSTACFARHCASAAASPDASPQKKSSEPLLQGVADQPSRKQLIQLGVACTVPMIAFGFMDNFIMITAGDAIDTKIGVTFGLTTMAAAGIGNLFSDVTGVFAGDAVEAAAKKAGMEEPELTDEQAEHRSTKLVKTASSVIGISIGCIFGMVPLLWIGRRKKVDMTNEELQLYEAVFAPSSVSLSSFIELVHKGKWRTAEKGDVIIEGGKVLTKFVIMSKGQAVGVKPDGTPVNIYLPKGVAPKEDPGHCFIRGCFIGGTRLMNSRSKHNSTNTTAILSSKSSKPYSNTVSASESSRYMEWEVDAIQDVLNEDSHLESVLISMGTKEVTKQLKQLKTKTEKHRDIILRDYELLLKAVVDDGVVSPSQRRFVDEFLEMHNIKDADRRTVLNKIGWTEEDWQKGAKSK